jgi:hypothetical protein
MARLGKYLSLCLVVILAVSSLLMIQSTCAQSIPKPSVPEFTLQFFGSPQYALVVTIKNQPYDSTFGTIYYNLRLKDHNAGNDSWIYPLDQLFYTYHTYPEQSTDSEYTNISITVQSNFLLLGIQNDIEIEAMLGTIGRDAHYNPAPYVFNGQTSDWSNTQTLNLNQMAVVTPNPSPSVPEFSWLAILPLFISFLSVAVIVRHRKPSNLKQ